jgi:hypothetical protein
MTKSAFQECAARNERLKENNKVCQIWPDDGGATQRKEKQEVQGNYPRWNDVLLRQLPKRRKANPSGGL